MCVYGSVRGCPRSGGRRRMCVYLEASTVPPRGRGKGRMCVYVEAFAATPVMGGRGVHSSNEKLLVAGDCSL